MRQGFLKGLIVGMLLNTAFAGGVDLPKGLIALDGRPAPALKLKNMDDASYDLSKAKGSWVLVHFWATWCGPCRRELPTVQRMRKKLSSLAFKLILVNTAEDDDTVFSFLPTVAPELDTLMDRDGSVTDTWQPRGLPATFFVDPQGKLRYIALGGRVWDSVDYLTFIKGLLKSTP